MLNVFGIYSSGKSKRIWPATCNDKPNAKKVRAAQAVPISSATNGPSSVNARGKFMAYLAQNKNSDHQWF